MDYGVGTGDVSARLIGGLRAIPWGEERGDGGRGQSKQYNTDYMQTVPIPMYVLRM